MGSLRWGIMGTGGIAAAMAGTLRDFGSPVATVGSVRPRAAEEFAARWGIGRAVDSHRAVAESDDVDVVYVATTNNRHFQNVLDCIGAGKAVLCEKPIALNATQANEMFSAAEDAGVFVMEAMWTRFLPFIAKLDELIDDGAIGAVRHIEANLSHPASTDPSRRWMNRDLGGGALLDLGIYPLTLIHHILGSPTEFQATAEIGATGIDLHTLVVSEHVDGASAFAAASFTAETPDEAIVAGSEGLIRIHNRFHHSQRLTVERAGEVLASFDVGFTGHGFRFEVAEAERCVREGLAQSPLRPHADTLAVMQWLDEIRSRIGLSYPADPE